MTMTTRTIRRRRTTVAWLVAGALAGGVAVPLVDATAAFGPSGDVPASAVEGTHLPPLLTVVGESVELEYDVHCLPAGDMDRPCRAEGAVYLRPGDRGAFREIRLARAPDGRLTATVPREISGSGTGFSYYAEVEDAGTGATTTLPSAGAAAPQRSYSLLRPVEVSLGAHQFGSTRTADARVVEARWGNGARDVGLEEGRDLTPIGGSSFQVAREGAVHLLDEANRRVLRWRPDATAPTSVPLPIRGTLADLAVADDGSLTVLETTADPGEAPLLRVFGAGGELVGSTEIAERAAQVRLGPEGIPFVLQHPSAQWMRVADDDRHLLPPRAQQATGRPGRPVADGGEVIVLRRGDEVLVARVDGRSVERAWRVTSETPLAEVQLAEPVGDRLVLVVRTYTDAHDEFLVLVLDERGLVDRFSVQPFDWAETAPLSRFRLAAGSLYQLGSTPAGLFVDRFDLEVGR